MSDIELGKAILSLAKTTRRLMAVSEGNGPFADFLISEHVPAVQAVTDAAWTQIEEFGELEYEIKQLRTEQKQAEFKRARQIGFIPPHTDSSP